MIRLLFAILLTALPCAAEPRYWGIDHLGGARYGKQLVESHPDGFALGIFTQQDLFGDALPVVDEALRRRKIPLVRYNLRWSDSHTFTRADFPKIVAEARRIVPLVVRYPHVECHVSGATEHRLGTRDAAELARQVLAVIPERCKYVNNPWEGRGSFIPPSSRVLNEVHGKHAQRPNVGGPYNYSFDGTDAFDVDVTKIKNRFNDAEAFFFWTSQNNGRRNAGDSTPRPQRKFWPTAPLISALAFLSTHEGPVSLPAQYTVKPKSDQHKVPPASRELKPVLILPARTRPIRLVGDNGRLIALSSEAQPFDDGRFRYYFPEHGYQIAEKAVRIHGKPTVNLEVGGKKVGRFNPAFPAGAFR